MFTDSEWYIYYGPPYRTYFGVVFFYLNLFYLIICLLVRMDDDYAGILAPDSRLPFPDSVTLSPSPFSTPTLYKNT